MEDLLLNNELNYLNLDQHQLLRFLLIHYQLEYFLEETKEEKKNYYYYLFDMFFFVKYTLIEYSV